MKKKFGAFGGRQFSLETLVGGRPSTTIFQNPGGGGGGLGGVAYKDRARPPPRGFHCTPIPKNISASNELNHMLMMVATPGTNPSTICKL